MARTTALNKIEELLYDPTFYKIIQGGQGAGKTYAVVSILALGYCPSYPDSIVTIVGMTYDQLKIGAIRDFKSCMKEVGWWEDDRWNITDKTYTFPNGSVMEFKSMDRMTARGPRRSVLFVNEANAISWEAFDQMANRTSDFVIIDYNPSAKFWAHEELVEKKPERTSFIILTYLDNEALPAQERDNIESKKPKAGEEPSNWWTVYGLGQIGVLEGNIYSGWIESSAEAIRKDGQLVDYGLDFGFGHPTGLVSIWECPDGSIGVIEELYKSGMKPSDYVPALESSGIDPSMLIVADSARPEIIAEIKRAGYRIIGANKDAGSVERGIMRVQERQIYFCGKNLKAEYLSYRWRTKRSTGETIYEPEKSNDDLMDAMRYAIDDLSRPRFDF